MKKQLSQSLWLAEPTEDTPQTIGGLLAETAETHPDIEAVVYSCNNEVANIRWTYAELNKNSGRLAYALLDYGYQPGDRIAIWSPNHPEWILLEYALAKAGLVLVTLNPLYKQAEIEFALNASEVKGIFHADEVQGTPLLSIIERVKPAVPGLRHIHSLSGGIRELFNRNLSDNPGVDVDPESVFMIQYTSGTTGAPKAAQLSHRGIATTAKNSYETWGFGPGDKVCHGFPLFHVGGSGNSTPGAAQVGATSLPLYIFKAAKTLDILEHEQCHGFIGVPTMLTAMLEDPTFKSRDLSSLRHIILGGTTVPVSIIERCEDAFGVEISNGYGLTEASGVACSTRTEDSVQQKANTSGRALPGVSLKVIDQQGKIAQIDTPGELCFQGPGRMLGYRNAMADQQAIDAEGWLHTGDMAAMDKDGYIRIVGRTKEMIIRGGENLSPSEIESFLLRHPDISEAAVLGLPDEKYGEEVCAALVMKPGATASKDEIRTWCAEHLSRWKVPRYIAFVESHPKTLSGKVQKHLLKEQMIAHFMEKTQ